VAVVVVAELVALDLEARAGRGDGAGRRARRGGDAVVADRGPGPGGRAELVGARPRCARRGGDHRARGVAQLDLDAHAGRGLGGGRRARRGGDAVVADLVVAELVAVVAIEHVASPSSASMRAPAAVAARAWWSPYLVRPGALVVAMQCSPSSWSRGPGGRRARRARGAARDHIAGSLACRLLILDATRAMNADGAGV
jgi:hypothetical protein